MSDFYRDRAEGSKLEDTLIAILQSKGLQAWKNPAPEGDYEGRCSHDLAYEGPKGEVKIEAKMDWLSALTGNLCIERPTLEHSKSELFVFGYPQFHAFTREEIEQLWAVGRKLLVGNPQVEASLVSKKIMQTVGQPFWKLFTRP